MAKRKSSMQEEVDKTDGEQLELIEVGPENIKKILPIAKAYKKVVSERVALNAKEKVLKEKLRDFAHTSGLKRLPDGSIRFSCGEGVKVELFPQDEKVKVTVAAPGRG